MVSFSLEGKTAVVLGAAGGIGSALALGLAEHGANLAVATASSMEALEKVAEEVRTQTGKKVVSYQVNVTDEESMAKFVAAVVAEFGGVDILVNSMGLNKKAAVLEYPMSDYEKMFDVNVKGTLIACKHFGKVMTEAKKGSIINLSSVRGIRGKDGGNSCYSATKGAVEMFTKCAAIELAPFNVRVNAIGPALIITQGTIHIKNNPELAEKYKKAIPLGRLGMGEDLVGATVYLASDAASFVTGQTIFVDGGTTAG